MRKLTLYKFISVLTMVLITIGCSDNSNTIGSGYDSEVNDNGGNISDSDNSDLNDIENDTDDGNNRDDRKDEDYEKICTDIDCSGHGTCFNNNGKPSCNCMGGYHEENLECVENSVENPCEGIECSGHGTCVMKNDKPECNCDEGFEAVGFNCIEKGEANCTLPPINGNKVIDINVNIVTVSGKITLNHSRMPDDTILDGTERGYITFFDLQSSSAYHYSIGETGEAEFAGTLFPGVYNVIFHGRNDSGQDAVPEAALMLAENLEITSDINKNFNMDTVVINGEITLNHSLMPDNTKSSSKRGAIEFLEKKTGKTAQVNIESSGKASYSIKLFKSDYDIIFSTEDKMYQNVLPDGSVLLSENMKIDNSGTLDFNINTTVITAKITQNSSRIADDTIIDGQPRGNIRFVSQKRGKTYSFPVEEKGEAIVSATLYHGTYDVVFGSLSSSSQDAVPQGGVILKRDLLVNSNISHSFNFNSVKISGEITLNHSTMPDNRDPNRAKRGQLVFTEKESGLTSSVIIDATGKAHYSKWIYVSNYDIALWAEDKEYQNAIPEGKVMLAENLKVNMNEEKNFNITVSRVTGAIALNSSRMPDDTNSYGEHRGYIRFFDKKTASWYNYGIGDSGEASYNLLLYNSHYDITFSGVSENEQDAVPEGEVMLAKDLDVSNNMSMDFDLKTAVVSGRVTLNHSTMPNDAIVDGAPRGYLSFVNKDTGKRQNLSIEETGEAYYEVTLYQSPYNIIFEGNHSDRQNVLPEGKISIHNGCRE